MKWIQQFGWVLAICFLTSFLCLGIAIFMTANRSTRFIAHELSQDSSSKVHDLETQLKEAQERIQTLTAAASAQTTVVSSATPLASATVTATDASTPESSHPLANAPIIDPALISPATPISASKPFLFKALPDQVQATPADVPIILGSPSARWNGKTLAVRFNLQYISKASGGQQGRIVILARGPGMILSHPGQVFQETGKDILIDPNKGEFFSVSRFRDTKADFGPISSRDAISEVEVLVLSTSGQLLIHEKIVPSQTPGSSPKASRPKHERRKVQEAEPESETEATSETGAAAETTPSTATSTTNPESGAQAQ
jgi:hypothetical protein